MFERFAKDARDAVTGAQAVARTRGDVRITSEHLLLALADAPSSVAAHALGTLGVDGTALRAQAGRPDGALDADALAAVGIDLQAVRTQVEGTFGRGALDRAAPATGKHIPFSTDAKKVLEQTLRVAVAEKSRRIDSGHLLVAISQLDRSPGGSLLTRAGVAADAARSAVERCRAA
ncbi:Clp protease N-terminal domain-containing protein [Cellulomonas edaphi]|uniref:Clp protease N-terminal domain-containing protein n=1 Tax=Cellulomonas edaphi TaxID=3053468 RepID=A0ABT7S8M9_9CELL|nr:Clp protease N-terminal domain-containing protein [Cellulomons edaphi]MDM7831936.1 Clp protease N-terminal domain-containing protein [Cellulomons edaphi]